MVHLYPCQTIVEKSIKSTVKTDKVRLDVNKSKNESKNEAISGKIISGNGSVYIPYAWVRSGLTIRKTENFVLSLRQHIVKS